METIRAFDAYILKLNVEDNPALVKFIKIHREIMMELQTEDEQSRYFENFIKELNLFLAKRTQKG